MAASPGADWLGNPQRRHRAGGFAAKTRLKGLIMKQTVLVTGAAGAVGSAVLAELLTHRTQFTVRALDVKTTRSQQILKPYSKEVEVCWGDLRVPGSFDAAVRGVEA